MLGWRTLAMLCTRSILLGGIFLGGIFLGMNAGPLAARAPGDVHDAPVFLKPTYQPDTIPRHQYDLTAERLPPSESTRPRDYFAAIYSGSPSGVYFYVASAVCDVLHTRFKDHNIHCVSLRSPGVSGNVQLMREGRAQMAIIQSDTNYNAAIGTLPMPGARSVMSLHGETGVMVVHPDSGIRSVGDLRGKRVNLGPEGSANRVLWDQFLDYSGIPHDQLGRVYDVQQSYNVQGLCDRYIEAFGAWIGHPSRLVEDAIETCGARLVGMDDGSEGIARLLKEHQYYVRATIPAGTYANQDQDIRSYGFKASLIAFEDASPHVVYWVVKTLVEEVEALREAHPALAAVEPRAMFEEGNFLPFHDGAARYWKERGWLKDSPPADTAPVPGS